MVGTSAIVDFSLAEIVEGASHSGTVRAIVGLRGIRTRGWGIKAGDCAAGSWLTLTSCDRGTLSMLGRQSSTALSRVTTDVEQMTDEIGRAIHD